MHRCDFDVINNKLKRPTTLGFFVSSNKYFTPIFSLMITATPNFYQNIDMQINKGKRKLKEERRRRRQVYPKQIFKIGFIDKFAKKRN